MIDTETLLQDIKTVAFECGRVMLTADADDMHTVEKSGFRDLVTEFDPKIQAMAVERLTALYPDADFVCEEGDKANTLGDGLTFVIDPIDGTANFSRGYRHSCISIAAMSGGAVVAGAVYNPFQDELFYARRGGGAYCNDRPIHTATTELIHSLVLFGSAPYDQSLFVSTLQRVGQVFGRCLDIRRSGSAALDMCYTAAGRVGLFFEESLSLWDFAAGAVILREAGGVCFKIDGTPLSFLPEKTSMLAGPAGNVSEALRIFAGEA